MSSATAPATGPATDLAGALATGPGTGSSLLPNHVQVEAFSQRSKDEWAFRMEKTRHEIRGSERTSRNDKYRYMSYLRFPKEPNIPKKEMKTRVWVIDNFFMDGEKLMRKPTSWHSNAREVKHEDELLDTIIQTHASLMHAGQEVTATAVVREFYGVSKREVVKLLKSCAICSRARPSKAKGPLKPIQSKRVFERVQIDLIDMSGDPDGSMKWICHMEDHFSKFHMMFPMPDKESATVAQMMHQWVCWLGVMEILQSDNGSEFKGVCEELLFRYGIKVINGRPRTPRTQGLVEQANGTVKKRIAAWKRQTGNLNWSEGLAVCEEVQAFRRIARYKAMYRFLSPPHFPFAPSSLTPFPQNRDF